MKSLLCGSMSDVTLLKSSGEVLGEVGIKRRILQGYSLSSLMFVLAVINLTKLLTREHIGYKIGRDQKLINHFLVMVDFKNVKQM